MESINYPVRVVNDYHIEETTDLVFQWLDYFTRVHFIYEDYILKCTHPRFPMVAFGEHPTVKIIFINEEVELNVNALVAVYNANCPEEEQTDDDGDGPTQVGDRRCPLCGEI